MRPFQELTSWQRSHELVLEVYRVTDGFPRSETFGLTSQLRRAVVSIPSNIAEGSVHDDGAEFQRFLGIALGSAAEVEYQLILARDLGYLDEATQGQLDAVVGEVKRRIVAFRTHLKGRSTASRRQPTANSQQPTASGAPS